MYTLEDFYKYGKGICDNYATFFILLALEKGLTENLYRVSGKRGGSGHAWVEYRTQENNYIIDPTWSDDYSYPENIKEQFRESPAYGRCAFFITYDESKIIFGRTRGQSYNHNTYTNKESTPIWERETNLTEE